MSETDDVWVNLHLDSARMVSARLSEIALIEDLPAGLSNGCKAHVVLRSGHAYGVMESYTEIMEALGNAVEESPG